MEKFKAWFLSKFLIKNLAVPFCQGLSYGYYVGHYYNGKRTGEWIWYAPKVDDSGLTMRIHDIKVKIEHYVRGKVTYTWKLNNGEVV